MEVKNTQNNLDSSIIKNQESDDIFEVIFSENKYILRKCIGGIVHIFGEFPSQYIALSVANILKENLWNVNYFKHNNIIDVKEKAVLLDGSDGVIKFLGEFPTYDDAKIRWNEIQNESNIISKVKDSFESFKNVGNSLDDLQNEHISKSDGIYRLTKYGVVYGEFDSYDDALAIDMFLDIYDDVTKINELGNIFGFNEKFYVMDLKDNFIKILDVFDTYSEALNFKNNQFSKILASVFMKDQEIIDSAEIDLDSIDDTFIYIIDNSYFIKRYYGGDYHLYGIFNTLDDAKIVKIFLNLNDWDFNRVNSINNIFKLNDKFYILYVISGRIYLLNKLDSLEDALEYKKNNAKEDLIKVYDNFKDGRNRNIFQDHVRGNFLVLNRIGGELKSFGIFRTREEAIKRRNELIFSDWPEEEQVDFYVDNSGLNEIIFTLDPWQKIVFDSINKLDSETFTLDDLKQFESTFKRFVSKDKIEKKVSSNVNDLVDLGLLVKLDDLEYQKLWDY